jgi:mono/diheme cytochrome c family protein
LQQPDRTQRPRRRTVYTMGAWLLVLFALAACAAIQSQALAPQAPSEPFDAALVEKGARLAAVGDCASCHTTDLARPFAGGRGLATPFGTVYSTNITPDAATGIGGWSEAAFTRAMREGVSRDGHLLYPAFPYDHYTRLTQDDIRALYAYFMTRPPLHAPARENDMRFPFGFRPLLAFWNTLYLDRTPWHPEPGRSPEWNRGAYLSDTLGHCGACHTPRTRLGGTDRKRYLDGGEAEGWYAPALNANSPSPLPWTREQLASYLRTGIADDHAVAGGPMQEVVVSLAQADRRDVEAIATYIHDYLGRAPAQVTPAAKLAPGDAAPASMPAPSADDPDLARMRSGYEAYVGACARCHEEGRAPTSGAALPLQKAVALYDPDPRSLVRIVREGIVPPDGEPARWMPGFAGILSKEQTVALAAYLRRYGAAKAPWDKLEDEVRKAEQP